MPVDIAKQWQQKFILSNSEPSPQVIPPPALPPRSKQGGPDQPSSRLTNLNGVASLPDKKSLVSFIPIIFDEIL